jgi:hypothetical protein
MSAPAITHDDLVVLTAWLAERGWSASSVAYAVEKPHKFASELSLARAVLEHETAFKTGPVHECQEATDGSGRWVCGVEWLHGVEQFCDWQWTPDGDR